MKTKLVIGYVDEAWDVDLAWKQFLETKVAKDNQTGWALRKDPPVEAAVMEKELPTGRWEPVGEFIFKRALKALRA